ncbi:hypothetical protein [Candidatus Palauibacter sp.]|uniref:hypothetical protein n=1 Tax=Candidatus Palauibacter sp. TaxID=3101350 RepID=UPI003AF290E5
MTGRELLKFKRVRSETVSRPRATRSLVLIGAFLASSCGGVHEPTSRQVVLNGTWMGSLGDDGGSPGTGTGTRLRLEVTAHRPAIGVERFTGSILVDPGSGSIDNARRYPVEGFYSPNTREVLMALTGSSPRYRGFVDEKGHRMSGNIWNGPYTTSIWFDLSRTPWDLPREP